MATSSADQWDARYAGTDLVWSAAPNVWVELVVAAYAPGRALDVAAGEGRNAFWLLERGWLVVAADFSPVAVERMTALARERGFAVPGRFEPVVADATRPAPGPLGASGDGVYDLVLLSYLHLPPPEWRAALESAVAACRRGGRIVVVQHATTNLTQGFGGPQDPDLLHDPEQLVASCAGLPVTVERAELALREVWVESGRGDNDGGRAHHHGVDPGHEARAGVDPRRRTAYDTLVVLTRH